MKIVKTRNKKNEYKNTMESGLTLERCAQSTGRTQYMILCF